jgi:hypothetical protein
MCAAVTYSYKYVDRVRLVKTVKPSVCVTVNYKECISAIAMYSGVTCYLQAP